MSLLQAHFPERLKRGNHARLITVGLVNNMSGRGQKATVRQFRQLLTRSGGNPPVRLRIFVLPEMLRLFDGQSSIAEHFEPIEELWTSDLDGLIVSGTEPRAATLEEEPCWPTLTRLVEWAECRTVSTIWSCLAAHLAVRYLDGIARRTLPRKLFGLFECTRHDPHPLLDGLPSQWLVPHSRYNEIPEERLIAHDYAILTRSRYAGADTFIKQNGTLHVFLQGHPEYDLGALSREYRRDIRRYLSGEDDRFPEIPQSYFPAAIADELRAFRQRALTQRRAELLAEFPTAATGETAQTPWAGVAARFYENWLSWIAARKYSRLTGAVPVCPALHP